MDCVGTIKSVLGIIQMTINLLREDRRLARKLRYGLESLMKDLDFIKEESEIYDDLQLTELVYDIEDFAQGLWNPKTTGRQLWAIVIDPREEYVDRIEFFQKEIKKLSEQRLQKCTEFNSEQRGDCTADTTSSSDPTTSSSAAGGYTPESFLVGIDEPKNVILDLLKKAAPIDQARGQDAKQRPTVISIVGCPGVGKTALARAVYSHYVASAASRDFDCIAWVEAAGCNDKTALLAKIIEDIQANLASRGSEAPVPSGGDGNAGASPDLHAILADKR